MTISKKANLPKQTCTFPSTITAQSDVLSYCVLCAWRSVFMLNFRCVGHQYFGFMISSSPLT